jgi:ASC-1-like (ASCH) protein
MPLNSYVIDIPINFNGKSNFSIDKVLIKKWRELNLEKIEEKEKVKVKAKKIFIKRNRSNISKRGIKNIEAFERMIQQNGFEIVVPQEFSLHEQIQIFNSADTVIIEEGAACANTIFMKSGANLILLGSYRAKNFELFCNLVDNFNIKFYKINSKFDFTSIFYQNFWDATNKLYRVSTLNIEKLIISLETK